MRMPQPATGPGAPGDSAADATRASDAAIVGAPEEAESFPVSDAASQNGTASQYDAAGQNGTASQYDAASTNGTARPNGTASTNGASAPGGPQRRASALASGALGLMRRHWIASALLTAGLVLRILTLMAYHPAIVYIDSLKYVYDAWPGSDPVGYKIPLRLILAVGDLGTVALVQHLLGLAIAVTIYVVMIRRGAPRWLGALAIAPVLLDGYQLQAEHMIMPDVWFEAMIVAGLAVILWQRTPSLRMIVIGSAILGASIGLRQAGEILVVPAVIFAVALGGGWRKVLGHVAAASGAFILAVLLYMSASAELTGHFRISESSNSLTYGRMAAVANCATLQLPVVERPLCPTTVQQTKGPDWLDHNADSPLKMYRPRYALAGSPSGSFGALVAHFNKSVERQQPTRVVSGILRDGIKLFAVSRITSPGDTPIWRWQFQGNFPSYDPYILIQHNAIVVALPQSGVSATTGLPNGPKLEVLNPAYGGAPQVDKPIADFLRSYQLGGGFTPGPLLALFTLAGLFGSLLIFARRRLTAARRQLVLACLLFFTTAVSVLAISDAFEFTWRYQLPALVTLPPAGALGIGVLIAFVRKSRGRAPAGTVSERAPELAAPAK